MPSKTIPDSGYPDARFVRDELMIPLHAIVRGAMTMIGALLFVAALFACEGVANADDGQGNWGGGNWQGNWGGGNWQGNWGGGNWHGDLVPNWGHVPDAGDIVPNWHGRH